MLNAFNNYFTDLRFILSQNISGCCIPPESSMTESHQEFIFYEVTFTNYCHHYHLRTKAAGLDGLPANLNKLALSKITKSLTTIFNRSISTDIFPYALGKRQESLQFKKMSLNLILMDNY